MELVKSLLEYGLLPSVAVIVAIVTWYLNHSSQTNLRQVQENESRYQSLLASLDGFYTSSSDSKAKETFLGQYRQCWLYSPDSVITAINEFLGSLVEGATSSEQKENLLGDCVLAMRRDLFDPRSLKKRRTELKASDFRHYVTTDDE